MKVGISTHIHVFTPLGKELFTNIKACGFECVEIYASDPHWPDFFKSSSQEKMARTCNDVDLEINSIHTPFFRDYESAKAGKWYSISDKNKDVRLESVDKIIDALAFAEHTPFKAAVVHVGASSEQEDTNTWERMFYSLEEIIPIAKKLKVGIALENITNDFSRGHRIADFIKESRLENLGCCYDSGHATIYDRTVDEFNEMAPHLLTTHIHDCSDGKDNHLLPFTGELNWPALAKAWARSEYEGDLIIETKDISNSMEMLIKAADAGKRLRDMIMEEKERAQEEG